MIVKGKNFVSLLLVRQFLFSVTLFFTFLRTRKNSTPVYASVMGADGLVVTSIKVDEALWKEAKKKAIDEGITLQDLLTDALKDWIKKKGGKLP
jgi:hypothetical protein